MEISIFLSRLEPRNKEDKLTNKEPKNPFKNSECKLFLRNKSLETRYQLMQLPSCALFDNTLLFQCRWLWHSVMRSCSVTSLPGPQTPEGRHRENNDTHEWKHNIEGLGSCIESSTSDGSGPTYAKTEEEDEERSRWYGKSSRSQPPTPRDSSIE